MATLNQIVTRINELADSHLMIHSFQFGEINEVGFHDQLDRFQYPLLFMQHNTNSVTRGQIERSFTLFIMDIPKQGEADETEVLSDMEGIGMDIISILHDPTFFSADFGLAYVDEETAVSMTPFTERFQDTLAGFAIDLTIIDVANDRCETPLATNLDCGVINEDVLFFDDFEGTLSKWSEIDAAADGVTYAINSGELEFTCAHTSTVLSFENELKSVTEFNTGQELYLKWDHSVTNPTANQSSGVAGFFIDGDNFIDIFNLSSNATDYRAVIKVGAATVYSVDVTPGLPVFKIYWDRVTDDIEFYARNAGDTAWVQFGTTQNFALGASAANVKLTATDTAARTGGDVLGFDDIYVTDTDFATKNP